MKMSDPNPRFGKKNKKNSGIGGGDGGLVVNSYYI